MQLYNKKKAVQRINELATQGKPFIFIINYAQDGSYIEEVNAVDPSQLLYQLNGYTNAPTPECGSIDKKHTESVLWEPHPISFPQYKKSFNVVMNNILAGNSFLTNLTCMTPISTNLSLKEIFYHSQAPYKLWLKDRFVVFSPEIFIRIHQGQISSYPMKGTIDATLPHAEELLMADEKEAAEHATIVDLIRNDLSIVASQVNVSRYRYVDSIETNHGPILQTSSEIRGTLPDDYLSRLGEIIFTLLPAGSITGAPKCKTSQIIAQSETYDRGFYTGIAGCFDGESLDSAVMIRFIEQSTDGLAFKSGGGITCKSCAENEYNEMIQKVYVPIY